MTSVKISTLHADLISEQEDRVTAEAKARAETARNIQAGGAIGTRYIAE